MLEDNGISIYKNDHVDYPLKSPFNPDREYPEYPFIGKNLIDRDNRVYPMVRDSLHLLNLDKECRGTSQWNPLGTIIGPGNIVVIKPNAVNDINNNRNESVFACITHGSIIRVAVDYTYKALNGEGQIIIADAPLMHSDFSNWKIVTGIDDIVKLYKEQIGFNIQVLDLRQIIAPWDVKNNYAPSELRYKNEDVRDGFIDVNLKDKSEFAHLSERSIRLFYGSDYNREHTIKHHLDNTHEYNIAKTFLKADTIISLPKLKVHSKVGVTLNIKGMVGTQGDKNYIPHHRIGPPSRGGDEYPDMGIIQNILNMYRIWLICNLLARDNKTYDTIYKPLNYLQNKCQALLNKIEKKRLGDKYIGNIYGGAWYGNDTAWRMALDLLHIILYANKDGIMCEKPQRNFFSIIDGIVGGECEGPLSPTGKCSNVILSGFNPLYVDIVSSRLMGFDPLKIKMFEEGLKKNWLNINQLSLDQLAVRSNDGIYESVLRNKTDKFLNFMPSRGWKNHIEIDGK